MNTQSPKVAVLLPCLNEAAAIGQVVQEFREVLPDACIYVYDNNSTDDTMAVAAAAGAVVRNEPRRGKGNVVRRMFAEVEADVYILADGDGTYTPWVSLEAVNMVWDQSYAMIVGRRVSKTKSDYRPGHAFGNKLFTRAVSILFGQTTRDVLSGYRVMSRCFVKSFPALSTGFEIESELTIFSCELRLPVADLDIPYRTRRDGTESKLRTFEDGFKIMVAIISRMKEAKPLAYFSLFWGSRY